MRVNEPITEVETEIDGVEPLVSRTDPGGRITFANHVFVQVSGFTEHELMGSPHNIVRHPAHAGRGLRQPLGDDQGRTPVGTVGEEPDEDRKLFTGCGQRDAGDRKRSGDRLHLGPLPAYSRGGRGGRKAICRAATGTARGHRVARRRN